MVAEFGLFLILAPILMVAPVALLRWCKKIDAANAKYEEETRRMFG